MFARCRITALKKMVVSSFSGRAAWNAAHAESSVFLRLLNGITHEGDMVFVFGMVRRLTRGGQRAEDRGQREGLICF